MIGVLIDCQHSTVPQVDASYQSPMTATAGHRPNAASVEGSDDMVDAVVNTLNPSVLVPKRSRPSGKIALRTIFSVSDWLTMGHGAPPNLSLSLPTSSYLSETSALIGYTHTLLTNFPKYVILLRRLMMNDYEQESAMPTNDKPVKLDMSFEDAIRFLANPKPASEVRDATHKGYQAGESCSTTADDPEAETSDSRTSERR